jgi:diguanylate cyclase (GGDEF)-like protein
MPPQPEWVPRRARGKSRPDPTAAAVRVERRRSLILTAALATVLLGLFGYTLDGSLRTSRATDAHLRSLALDALFSEARNGIALEEAHLRYYQVEPSLPVRLRFVQTAGAVTTALERAARDRTPGSVEGHAAAGGLLAEQRAYRELADRLIDLLDGANPDAARLDRQELAPAYITLQAGVEQVSQSFHIAAAREATEMSRAQSRMFLGTTIGFLLGLTLVAMIWRLVLGYQRRLVAHAAASQEMALRDPLTGLPNRAYFTRRLREAVDAAQHDPNRQLALMILDLNGFKAVNDTLGHQAGDQLLEAAGQRLRDAVRADAIVARLGGDEFAVLLPHVEDGPQVKLVADRINDVLRSDFRLTAGPAAVSGSVGVATGFASGDTDELVRNADTAMYRAKAGGGGVAYYDPNTDLHTPDRMGLFSELRALLDSGDPWVRLALHYQPQMRISDGSVSAVEALVRWHHSTGLLMPEEFLPLAEARGLEIPLTYHLLGAAADQAVRWYRGGSPKVVSVNVSPRCLLDEGFVPRVREIVDGLPPRLLRLEITESSVMTDPERAVAALHEVHEMGVLISVDDYGTGFSSMSQLKRLPADELKIDRAFVRDITSDTGDEVLVRSTIALAHDLGMSTVAEGVEDLAALALLGELGCDYAQGYAISPAVPAAELPEACRRAEARVRQFTRHRQAITSR